MTQHPAHLHTLLLVGTSRAPFSADALPAQFAALIPGAEATPERRLWLATGALALWNRAGYLPAYLPPPASALPAPACAAEQLASCPPRAEAVLRRLLQDSLPAPLLQEWLTLLNARRARLPQRYLPNLLELATRQAGLRSSVRPALGTRGQWLAHVEPGWSWAAEIHDSAHLHAMWENGSPAQRSAALEAWRQQDPAAARAALEAAWASEAPEQRLAFIDSLGINLAAGDENFLEAALDDRRKPVRVAAQRLLARLPGSGLSQRMLARVGPWLQLEKRFLRGSRLVVNLPDACDAAMARDGVGEGKYPGLGEKAGWLADVLAAIDPSHWSAQFEVSPDECIALAAATDYQEALLLGWTAALHLHLARGATPALLAWLGAWTRTWLESDGTVRHRNAPAFVGAWLALPPAAMHAALLERVAASATVWSERDLPLVELLQRLADGATAPWPPALSQAIATRLLGSLPGLSSQQWSWRAALPVLATVLDPGAVIAAQPQGPMLGDDAQGWQGPVDQFFHVVRFRHEMISSFQEPA